METSSPVQCMNELLQLYLSEVQPRLQLATAQAMSLALDKCTDVVHITDQNLNIQVSVPVYVDKGRGKVCPCVSVRDGKGVPSAHWAQYKHSWRSGNHYGKETSSALKD
jgi:hypothetical protein